MLINPDDALSMVLEDIEPLGTETVSVFDALGRVIADRTYSKRDIPIRDSSAMDGYAVRHEDISKLPAKLIVKGVIAAGDIQHYTIATGECYRIMTGAYMPQGADTVVEHELTDNGTDTVEIREERKLADNVRYAKDDIARGAVIDYRADRVTPYHISRYISTGAPYLPVYRKPRIAVISTGSEIISSMDYDDMDRMLEANAPAVIGMLQEAGAECS